ncbi:MAG: LamG-like jellyroll fold domain-containing protein [Ferruginibacter sp.]
MKHLLYTIAIVIFFSVLAKAQPTVGLVAYWPMNGNFNDAGPNAINGTNIGATATTNNYGTANAAMNFSNPAATVVQCGSHPVNANLNFGTAQDFSIGFSVFANSPFVHTGGFYDNNLNYAGVGIWFWSANGYPQIQFNFKNGSVGTTNGAFALGVWNKICCVREGTALRIYINGVLNVTGTPGTSTPAYNYVAKFGTMTYAGQSPPDYNGFNGKLDEFRIYNRVLTQAEITTLATLPIKLGSFTAAKNNADILLQWQTVYEQNSDHFNVQRSTDGSNFSNIATVKAKGNSSVATNYQFTDNTVKNLGSTAIVFYRLESVDIDGRKDNSAIVSVKLNTDKKELIVLENPVRNDLRLQFTSVTKENATIIITDASGRQVLTNQMPVTIMGTVSTVVPVNGLAAGMYYITIVSGQDKQTRSFIKQ